MSKSQQATAPAPPPRPVHKGEYPWQFAAEGDGDSGMHRGTVHEFPWQVAAEADGNAEPHIGSAQEFSPQGAHADYLFG